MLSVRDRLRLSSTLAAKTAALKAGAGLSARERMALAKGIRELVAQLTGGVVGAGPATPDDELSDDPNSPNYRYADTGYIADSRKEKAATQIALAKATGQQVQATAIDWKAIEQNPRAAAELIVKSNLFGQVDWEALGAAGMDPAAGFLIDRVYASIAPQPDDNPQTRHDYAVALTTIRARMEKVKTVKEVRDVLAEILDELRGANLNEDETAQYEALRDRIHALRQQIRDLEEPVNALYREANATRTDEYQAEGVIGTRKRRGWEIKDEHTQALADAQTRSKEAWKRWETALRAKNDAEKPLKAELLAASDQANRITAEARARNEDSALVRGWMSFGPKFLGVLKYRFSSGSSAFMSHVVNAEAGKVKDWSWATKERVVTRGATKNEVQFQLQVVDSFERIGGKAVKAESTAAFKSMFGLREVQSGNWVLKDPNSAKFHVEQSAAAFSDLSELMGVDAAHLGLGGRLAMAFGARGNGGKGAARAHYESRERVVALTKQGGGGALGHELFHAFDNILPAILSGAPGKKDDFATNNPEHIPAGPLRDAFAELRRTIMTGGERTQRTFDITDRDRALAKSNVDGFYSSRPGPGATIKAAGNATDAVLAIDALLSPRATTKKGIKNLNDWKRIAVAYYAAPDQSSVTLKVGPAVSKYAAEAGLLDNGEQGKYWSQDVELAARAFQAWCEDTLESQGRRNDYLSAMADNKFYVITGDKPFPEGDERKAINAAFDKLFSVIRDEKVFEKASANKPLLDAIFGEAPTDTAETWPRSWLGFSVVDQGYVNAKGAEYLPSAHALGGAVWINLADDLGEESASSIPVSAWVVGTSFTADKVRYCLAVQITDQVRDGVQLYAVIPEVPSELVSSREVGAVLDYVGTVEIAEVAASLSATAHVSDGIMDDAVGSRLSQAREFAAKVEAINPKYSVNIEQASGGSVYALVLQHELTSKGERSKRRRPWAMNFKVRFADHGGYWGSAISIDPITGNTVKDAVQLFQHAIDPASPAPEYFTSSIDPPTGRQFRCRAKFNRMSYERRTNPTHEVGQREEVAGVGRA